MIDRPDAERLLRAIADSLSDVVVPVLAAGSPDDESAAAARYTTRIAVNLCRIVARDAAQGPEAEAATVADLRTLLGRDRGSLAELSAALDDRLRDGDDDLDPKSVHRLLTAAVERRLAIAHPTYLLDRADADGGS